MFYYYIQIFITNKNILNDIASSYSSNITFCCYIQEDEKKYIDNLL